MFRISLKHFFELLNETMKPLIISFLSLFGLNVLQIYKDIQPVLFDILQIIIALMTIYYIYLKTKHIKHERKKAVK